MLQTRSPEFAMISTLASALVACRREKIDVAFQQCYINLSNLIELPRGLGNDSRFGHFMGRFNDKVADMRMK